MEEGEDTIGAVDVETACVLEAGELVVEAAAVDVGVDEVGAAAEGDKVESPSALDVVDGEEGSEEVVEGASSEEDVSEIEDEAIAVNQISRNEVQPRENPLTSRRGGSGGGGRI